MSTSTAHASHVNGNQTRRGQAGLPGNGGQFAPDRRSDADPATSLDTIYEPVASSARPAAYLYDTEVFTPEGIVDRLRREGRASPAAVDMSVEDVLDQIAGVEGVDRDDETLFDSSEFPKTVWYSEMADGDTVVGPGGAYLTWTTGSDSLADDDDGERRCSDCGDSFNLEEGGTDFDPEWGGSVCGFCE
jgi:hypothetical protein